MPKRVEPWSPTSLREKLIKIGTKVVSHGRYAMFQVAEIAVSRHMFREILMLIAQLRGRSLQYEGALVGRPGPRWERCVLMKADEQVPAPQGKAIHGFHLPGQSSRANLVANEVQRWPKSRHNLGNLGNVG